MGKSTSTPKKEEINNNKDTLVTEASKIHMTPSDGLSQSPMRLAPTANRVKHIPVPIFTERFTAGNFKDTPIQWRRSERVMDRSAEEDEDEMVEEKSKNEFTLAFSKTAEAKCAQQFREAFDRQWNEMSSVRISTCHGSPSGPPDYTTHVVVDAGSILLEDRLWAYLGFLIGAKVVDYNWILDSVKQSKFLKENKYQLYYDELKYRQQEEEALEKSIFVAEWKGGMSLPLRRLNSLMGYINVSDVNLGDVIINTREDADVYLSELVAIGKNNKKKKTNTTTTTTTTTTSSSSASTVTSSSYSNGNNNSNNKRQKLSDNNNNRDSKLFSSPQRTTTTNSSAKKIVPSPGYSPVRRPPGIQLLFTGALLNEAIADTCTAKFKEAVILKESDDLDDNIQKCSHLVCGRGVIKRTYKMLRVMVMHGPACPRIVHKEWLFQSFKLGSAAPNLERFAPYENRYRGQGRFIMAEALRQRDLDEVGLFKGITFLVSENVEPTPEELKKVIETANGRMFNLSTDSIASCQPKSTLVVLSKTESEESVKLMPKVVAKKLSVVRIDYVIDCILHYKVRPPKVGGKNFDEDLVFPGLFSLR